LSWLKAIAKTRINIAFNTRPLNDLLFSIVLIFICYQLPVENAGLVIVTNKCLKIQIILFKKVLPY
jgi:hypothetical protein